MQSNQLAIVVVPRDRFSMFRSCLDALLTHTPLPFRLIVVAGGADALSRRYLSSLRPQGRQTTLLAPQEVLAQIAARVTALREVRERYCVIVENDTIVHANWLPPLLACMEEERAGVVMPLILWYRGLHASGCRFDERSVDGTIYLGHRIEYDNICRRRIDYPESHCILIDRQLVSNDVFDDVEPFDVDFGLTLRERRVPVFVEPASRVTYTPPPPLTVGDVPAFLKRWDPLAWEQRNRRFATKWGVKYQSSPKLASYRRQLYKLGLARWYATPLTIGLSNAAFGFSNCLQSVLQRRKVPVSVG